MPENEVAVVQKFDLEELIYNFHRSGIHVVIQTSNVGLMLTITDRLYRIRREQLIEWPTQEHGAAAKWLHGQALMLFPNSDYARLHSAEQPVSGRRGRGNPLGRPPAT
ncbi:MAG: hypothetical protein ACXU9B_04080 [Reyranella sp.]